MMFLSVLVGRRRNICSNNSIGRDKRVVGMVTSVVVGVEEDDEGEDEDNDDEE